MFRKIVALFLSVALCWTMVSCGGSTSERTSLPKVTNERQRTALTSSSVLADGKYPVQQASYDDSDGKYTLMLLNTPTGTSPTFQTQRLQMARLTDEQIKQNEKTFLEVKNKEPVIYLAEDFKIEYLHSVTEARNDPQTGSPQNVVVRQESSFWNPFAGALAGQALGSLLFRPQHYIPPAFQSGSMRGFGGYGSSYNQAVDSYQTRYNQPPAAVRNRQTLRSTGSFGSGSRSSTGINSNKSSGAGFGSSRLKSSGKSYTPSGNSFGSSSGSRRSSFGSGGRRR